MPTDSAANRPLASSTVALRSFDWLRIGVVAVRDTNSAISKHTVSMPPRMTSAVTGSTVGASEMRPRLPANRTKSTFVTASPSQVTRRRA